MCGFRVCLFLRTCHACGRSGNVVSSTRGQSSFMQMTDVAAKEAALLRCICVWHLPRWFTWIGLFLQLDSRSVTANCRHAFNVVRKIKWSITLVLNLRCIRYIPLCDLLLQLLHHWQFPIGWEIIYLWWLLTHGEGESCADGKCASDTWEFMMAKKKIVTFIKYPLIWKVMF